MLPVFATNSIDLALLIIVSVIWLVSEFITIFIRNRPRDAQAQERVSGIILIASIYIGISLGLNVSFSATQFAIPGDRMVLFGIGIFLILAGMAFRWYSIWILGKFFTSVITVQEGQKVIDKGPYRLIRHPSYSGAMLSFLGFGLALTNWLGLGLVVLGAVIGYSYRVRVEEQALVEGLGQPYLDYMLRTKRFIPFVF
jgi:protein-S-isoprenylcysteine O-methyltransferase Ste14